MSECAKCEGSGKLMAHINRGPDSSTHSFELINCIFCNGSGVHSPELERRRQAGHEWYDRARKDGELMIEVGARLGLTPSEVSAIRQGRAPVPKGT